MCDAPYHRRLFVRVSGDSFLEVSRSDRERKVDGGKVQNTCGIMGSLESKTNVKLIFLDVDGVLN